MVKGRNVPVPPHCVMVQIRELWPEERGNYMGYKWDWYT